MRELRIGAELFDELVREGAAKIEGSILSFDLSKVRVMRIAESATFIVPQSRNGALEEHPSAYPATEQKKEDGTEVPPLELDSFCRGIFAGRFIRPVELTRALYDDLLACLPKGMLRTGMRKLFESGNLPIFLPQLDCQRINQLLIKKPINGRYYRLARGHGVEQLWEVEPLRQ